MKIINTGCFYFEKDDCAYRGKIQLSQAEFFKALKTIENDPNVSYGVNGSGLFPYLSKRLLQEDVQKRKLILKDKRQYSLRVGFADYILNMFKNTSRYNYKPQNYLIEVLK